MAKEKSYWIQDDYKKSRRRVKNVKSEKPEIREEISENDLLAYEANIKKEFWFPFWGKYLAWFLSITVIVTCSVMLVLYGATFGIVKSKIWLITVLTSMAFSTFLVQPVKAIALAVVLSYFFRRERSGFHKRLTLDMLHNPYDEAKAAEVEELRSKMAHLYKPQDSNEMRTRKVEIFHMTQAKNIMTDITSFVLYIVVIYLLAVNKKPETSFYSTETIKRLVIRGEYTHSIPFMRVKSWEQFYEYMNETLIPALMKNESLGYIPRQMINATRADRNETAMPDRGYTMDPHVKLLGQPRLRQLRVQTQSCRVHQAVVPTRRRDCLAELDIFNMDTDSYTLGWRKHEQGDPQPPGLEWDPWQYHSDGGLPRIGRQIISKNGGYMFDLGRTITNAQENLEFIHFFHWIDSRTRVVYIDFTTFSVGSGLFNVITLLFDVSASGVFIPSYSITTSQFLTMSWYDFSIKFLLITITAILFFITTAGEIIKMKNLSLRVYFTDAWSLWDFLIFLLKFFQIICQIIEIIYVIYLIKDLEQVANKDVLDFQQIALWDYISTLVNGILIFAITVRLFKLATFIEAFHNWEKYFATAWKRFMGLYTLLIYLIVMFGVFFMLYLRNYSEEFNSAGEAMKSLLYYSMRRQKGFDPSYLIHVPSTAIFYLAFLFLTNFVASVVFEIVLAVCLDIVLEQPVRSTFNLKQSLRLLIFPNQKTIGRPFQSTETILLQKREHIVLSQVDEIRLQGMKRIALEMITGKNYLDEISLNVASIVVSGNSNRSGTDRYLLGMLVISNDFLFMLAINLVFNVRLNLFYSLFIKS